VLGFFLVCASLVTLRSLLFQDRRAFAYEKVQYSGKLDFQLRKSSPSGSEASLEVNLVADFFATENSLYAETIFTLPGGTSKEKYAILINASEEKYYIIYPETLNYQRIIVDERAKPILKILPTVPTLEERKLASIARAHKLSVVRKGRKKVNQVAYTLYELKKADAEANEHSPKLFLYFTQKERVLRVIEVEAGEWHLRIVLRELKASKYEKEKFELPKGFYEMEPLELPTKKDK